MTDTRVIDVASVTAIHREMAPEDRAEWRPASPSVCVASITAATLLSPAPRSRGRRREGRDNGAEPARSAFQDVAATAGVSFRFDTGSRGKHDLPEVMGGGVAILDADGDGLPDLYFCNGGPIGDRGRRAGPALPALSQQGGLAVRGHHRPCRRPGTELRDGGGRRRLRRRRPRRPVRHRLARPAAVSQPRRRPVRGRDRARRAVLERVEHLGGLRRSRRRRRPGSLRRDLCRLRPR